MPLIGEINFSNHPWQEHVILLLFFEEGRIHELEFKERKALFLVLPEAMVSPILRIGLDYFHVILQRGKQGMGLEFLCYPSWKIWERVIHLELGEITSLPNRQEIIPSLTQGMNGLWDRFFLHFLYSFSWLLFVCFWFVAFLRVGHC